MRRLPLFILALASSAAACSGSSHQGSRASGPGANAPKGESTHAPGADGGKNDTAAKRKDVCVPLDYGHETPNADYFLTFADDAAALEYSKAFLAENEMPSATEVSHDERLSGLVARVYSAYRKIFPRETAGLDSPPRLVVVRAPGVNAFAGFDDRPTVKKAPWLFYVHDPVLQHPKSDELAGLFSHELAHLILRNLLPETRAKMRIHYRVPGGDERGIIGAVAEDDPIVSQRTEEMRELGAKVGRDPAFGPMPLSAFAEPQYHSMLKTLMGTTGEDQRACSAAADGLKQMQGLYQGKASIHDYLIHLTREQMDELGRLGRTTATAMKKCYPNVKESLFELKVRGQVATLPATEAGAMLQKLLDPTTPEHKTAQEQLMTNDFERQVDANGADTPTIDRLISVVETLHRRLGDFESDASLPIDELRVFDLEEDADDAAVRILRAIGEDPLANGRLFVGLMPDPEACFKDVERGKVPYYGRFVDPHNTTCWRWFHTNQLAKALERCPATPSPATASPAAPAPSSAADLRPSLLLERGPSARLSQTLLPAFR